MKKLIVIASALFVTACTDTSSAPTVVDPVIGKTLTVGNAFFVLNADGTLTGQNPDGDAIIGTYTANATEICSAITTPPGFAGERCSVPVYDGNTVLFNRRDGSQSPVYTIEG